MKDIILSNNKQKHTKNEHNCEVKGNMKESRL